MERAIFAERFQELARWNLPVEWYRSIDRMHVAGVSKSNISRTIGALVRRYGADGHQVAMNAPRLELMEIPNFGASSLGAWTLQRPLCPWCHGTGVSQ